MDDRLTDLHATWGATATPMNSPLLAHVPAATADLLRTLGLPQGPILAQLLITWAAPASWTLRTIGTHTYLIIGDDGGGDLGIRSADGMLVALYDDDALWGRLVNTDLATFLRCLALYRAAALRAAGDDDRDPVQVAQLEHAIQQCDPVVWADPESWWRVGLEYHHEDLD